MAGWGNQGRYADPPVDAEGLNRTMADCGLTSCTLTQGSITGEWTASCRTATNRIGQGRGNNAGVALTEAVRDAYAGQEED